MKLSIYDVKVVQKRSSGEGKFTFYGWGYYFIIIIIPIESYQKSSTVEKRAKRTPVILVKTTPIFTNEILLFLSLIGNSSMKTLLEEKAEVNIYQTWL